MNKSSFLNSKLLSKNNITLFLIAAMLVGFLCARAVGSVAIFLFAVNALRDIHPKKWRTQRWYLLGLVWVGMYGLSGLWTETQGPWNDPVQVKLPFLLLPLAFGFLPPWDTKQLRVYTIILVSIMLCGVGYSLSFFLKDPMALIEGYKYSHTLRSPVYNDHISFSAAIAVTIAWCVYSLRIWSGRNARILIGVVVILFAAYLHLLAAKTGVLALYILIFAYVARLLLRNWKMGLLAMVLSIAVIVGMYKAVPTFHERVNYMYNSFARFKEGDRTGNYSDIGRWISYSVSARIIAEHPLIGVGAGDMKQEMDKGYAQWYPSVNPDQRLIPHNQVLIVALATGIPNAIIFLIWLIAPLAAVKRNRNGYFFIVVWLMLAVQLFTDTALEVQFGVFVYLFFILMQRSMLRSETKALAN